MTWLTPLTGAIVAAIVVPPLLLLYFLKLRRTSRSIPSTMLWRRSVEDVRANAPFQRLRPSILLLLQLLVLLLLVLALAQPQFQGGASSGGRTVIAVDHSGSMNTRDQEGGPTRLERAKEAAVARIEALHGGGLFSGGSEEIMVVAFADGADVRTPFTDSRKQAIDAVNQIQPTDEPSAIGEALELARAFTVSVDPETAGSEESFEQPAVFEIFSDGLISDVDDQPLRAGESVSYTVIGSSDTRNIGLTQIAAERPWDRPSQIQVFAVVANNAMEPVKVDVELRVGGRARAVTPEPLDIPAARIDEDSGRWIPGRERVAFVPFEQPRGAMIEVRLLGEDGLASDDEARLLVPPPQRLRIALVGENTFVLQSLMEGMPLESLELLSPAQYALAVEGGLAWDVVVFLGWTPEVLVPGRYLVFNSLDGLGQLQPFGEAERVLVRSMRDEHPVFHFVTLDDLFIWTMPKVVTDGNATVLVEAVEGPVIAEIDQAGVQAIWVAFDPLDSNWWHQRSFANFVPNAIDYLATIGGALVEKGIEPGDAISMLLDRGSTNGLVTLPDGSAQAAHIDDDGVLSWGPARRAGIYEVSWSLPDGSEERARVAVNMLEESEGRVDAREVLDFSIERVSGQRIEGASQFVLWPWLLGVGLVILLLEWFYYHRRVAI